VLIRDLLERGDGGGGRRKRTDFVAHVPRLVAVGGIAQHGAHRCADRRGVALGWPDDAADPELAGRLRAAVLRPVVPYLLRPGLRVVLLPRPMKRR
jgi:hypothetical protein